HVGHGRLHAAGGNNAPVEVRRELAANVVPIDSRLVGYGDARPLELKSRVFGRSTVIARREISVFEPGDVGVVHAERSEDAAVEDVLKRRALYPHDISPSSA